MLIAIHGVKLNAQCYAWSEALCSMLYNEWSNMLIAIQGVKRYVIVVHGVKHFAHFYTWSEDLCSLLYKE